MPRCTVCDVGWGGDDRACWNCGATATLFAGNPPRPADAMHVTAEEAET